MSRHAVGGNVNWVGGSQEGAIRLKLEVAVSGLHRALSKTVAARSIQPDSTRGSGHSGINNSRRTGQHQNLVGRCVTRSVSRGLLSSSLVIKMSFLRQRFNSGAGAKVRVNDVAGADPVRLLHIVLGSFGRHYTRVSSAVDL